MSVLTCKLAGFVVTPAQQTPPVFRRCGTVFYLAEVGERVNCLHVGTPAFKRGARGVLAGVMRPEHRSRFKVTVGPT